MKCHKKSVIFKTSVVQVNSTKMRPSVVLVHSTKMRPSRTFPAPVVCNLQSMEIVLSTSNLLSKMAARAPTDPNTSTTVSTPKQVTFAGNTHTMNKCNIVYSDSKQEVHAGPGAFLDGGANVVMRGFDG